ncbi:MAG: alpha/beta hydrolase [Actinobacteria bacterium ATB1]|nr:alpha/beta hydrolase [Actinobacteria bacterium ATB1]
MTTVPGVEVDATVLRLSTGRRVGVAEWGDPDGVPLLFFHGTPGSRLTGRRAHDAALEHGVRVIAVERPGYGLSDPVVGRSLLDWAGDVAVVADHLGIDRFAVAGVSGGGPYVHSCAAAIPERLTVGCVMSGAGIESEPGAMEGAMLANRVGVALASNAPWLFDRPAAAVDRLFGSMIGPIGARVVSVVLERSLPEADTRALVEHDGFERMTEEIREAFRQGLSGFASDSRCFARPWGFDPADCSVPIFLWHGDQDRNVPVRQAEAMAARIPKAELRIASGEGHMLLGHWAEVCEVVAGHADAPRE